jgi:hypothetical protein
MRHPGNKRHKQADRKDDLYETFPPAVAALLAVEHLPDTIWEPACGPGSIVRVLRAAGHVVYATDLIDYKSPDQDESGWDFLMEKQLPMGVQAIVTNPPYYLAQQFVERALDLCPKVIMLLRLAFLESDRRTALLEERGLARVHLFRKRLPMMHRDGWAGPKASSAIPFAWFVWDADHSGPPIVCRLSWEESTPATKSRRPAKPLALADEA